MKSLNVYGRTSPHGAHSSGRKRLTMDPFASAGSASSGSGSPPWLLRAEEEEPRSDVFSIPTTRKQYCLTCGQVIELELWFDVQGDPTTELRRHKRWIDGFPMDCIGAGVERDTFWE